MEKELKLARDALEPFTERNSSDEFITIRVRTTDVAKARAAIAAADAALWRSMSALPPLPEPHAWQHEDGSSSFISNRVKTTVPASGKWPAYYSAPLYTADQMREYGERCRAQALEELKPVAVETETKEPT